MLPARSTLQQGDDSDGGDSPEATQLLRIASVFLILAASLLGTLPPILFGSRLGDGRAALLLKSLGIGARRRP